MIRLIIADGSKETLDGLNSLLSFDTGIDVIGQAIDGDEVLSLLKAGKIPDLLITDIHLPKINGILLAQHFSLQLPFVRTILFTMEEQEHYIRDAYRSGVKSYINKGVGREELLFAIRQVYHGKNYMCTDLVARLTDLFLNGRIDSSLRVVPMVDLSAREREVLQLIADGCTNQEIADKLFTSRRTVEGHRQAMINKTGVRNTPALVKYAMRYQLLELNDQAIANTASI